MTDLPSPLDDVDLAILRFERQWWLRAGAKEVQIRERFGLEPTRYYQRLNRLIDDPAAQAVDPVLCNRLHRIRDRRSAAHSRGRKDPAR